MEVCLFLGYSGVKLASELEYVVEEGPGLRGRMSRRRRRKDLKENHRVGSKLNFNLLAQVADLIYRNQVSIKGRLTPSTISYVGSISSSSSFESRPPIGRKCQRRHSNDQCSLLET